MLRQIKPYISVKPSFENAPSNDNTMSANAASLKLSEFWGKSSQVWFACVEAQFETENIAVDQTNFACKLHCKHPRYQHCG